MKHAWLVALMASVATPAVAQQYQYVARTEAPAARQGAVTAGILTWQCQGSACTISGPWPAPAAQACAQLAREVGRIVSYGREGNMLTSAGLARCNEGIAATAVAPTLRLPPRVITGGPLITVRPQPQPSQPQPSQPQPQPEPTPTPEPSQIETGVVNVPELSFVVGGLVPPPPPPPPPVTTRVDVPQLSFVVGGPVPPPPPPCPPVTTTVAVPELTFIVR